MNCPKHVLRNRNLDVIVDVFTNLSWIVHLAFVFMQASLLSRLLNLSVRETVCQLAVIIS